MIENVAYGSIGDESFRVAIFEQAVVEISEEERRDRCPHT